MLLAEQATVLPRHEELLRQLGGFSASPTPSGGLQILAMISCRETFARRHPSLVDPASFRPLITTVKRIRIHARVCLLGVPVGAVL